MFRSAGARVTTGRHWVPRLLQASQTPGAGVDALSAGKRGRPGSRPAAGGLLWFQSGGAAAGSAYRGLSPGSGMGGFPSPPAGDQASKVEMELKCTTASPGQERELSA